MNRHKFQWRQELHDQLFHQDIYVLDRQRKLTHLVLHMAKYNGKVFAVDGFRNTGAYDNAAAQVINQVAVDASIVLMSMANALNFELPVLDLNPYLCVDPALLIKAVGVMCKGLEGLDHMEQQDIRAMFHAQILLLVEQWETVFADTYLAVNPSTAKSNLTSIYVERVHKRWEQVEAKHIFYAEICKKHPLVAVGHRL